MLPRVGRSLPEVFWNYTGERVLTSLQREFAPYFGPTSSEDRATVLSVANPLPWRRTDVVRLPTLGTALSISLKVNGPSTNNHWEVNAMAFTYNPRRLR